MAQNLEAGAERIPRHVAIIMDGNGRWAQKRLLPRKMGHAAGMKRMIALADHAFSVGVEYLTLFALSAENLSRPKEEVEALFSLFREYFTTNLDKLVKRSVKLKVIGNRSLLPEDLQNLIKSGEEQTARGTQGTIALAIAYGGRQEILEAVKIFAKKGSVPTEEEFSSLLGGGLPAPDLLIRTGKEKRISNFLLWELAYTELYFSDKMFPAFSDKDFDRAVKDYAGRDRRFGRV